MRENYSLGLIGYPLKHSFSPRIHRAALRALGLKGKYRLYPVPPLPEGNVVLEDLLNNMRQGSLHGLNVTIPHKQSVLQQIDKLTPSARFIGAVNTISLRGGQLQGDNTDASGFLADLNRLGWSALVDMRMHALVLGSGGAARAVVYALARAGWNVTVAGRRLERAEELVHLLQPFSQRTRPTGGQDPLGAIHLDRASLAKLRPSPCLIINATPLGMQSQRDTCAWPLDTPFPPKAAVYDLVYNPPETLLMKIAREEGLRAANGLGMLIEQAALSFTIWTGHTAPRDAMWEAVKDLQQQ
jgi:shikimate dehydrogenase